MNEPLAPPSWADTRALIRSDFERLLEMADDRRSLGKRLFWFLLPTFQGLLMYRVSRFLHLRGRTQSANLLYLFSLWTTRLDIPPRTQIGPACRLGHPPIILCGRIGARFTSMGFSGLGGGFGSEDIGAGPGLPVIGDDVTIAIKAAVLGPVRIGDGARIGPGAVVTRDVPAGAIVAAPLARISVARSGQGADAASPRSAPESAPAALRVEAS